MRSPYPEPHPPADLDSALYVIAWVARCGVLAVACFALWRLTA